LAIESGEEALVLRISEEYPVSFMESRPASLELILDDSKRSTRIQSTRVEQVIQAYGGQVAALRLLARGVSPSVVQTIALERIDLATPQTKASNILEMVGMFLIMAAFACNMYIAIDASAGERERGSLEPLLIQPVSRWNLVLGKWLATVVFGLMGGILTLLCLVLAMHRLPLENIGLRLILGWHEALVMLLVAVPLIFFAGAGQLTLASFAKSFKEAQTYLSLTLMLPMIPGMLFSMKPMEPELWMAAVPALGQQIMTTMILRGESIPWSYWVLSIGVSMFLTVLSLWFCVRLFSSEHFFRK
jgi:sodium transport system permease protein